MRRTLHGATAAERLTARYIPKGARLVPGPAGGAAYAYDVAGKAYAIAYKGTAARSLFHNSFRTPAQRDAKIAEFHASLIASAQYRAGRTADAAAWSNPLMVGTILYTSWGYDQTNTEFFAVTRVSGRRVYVREIAADYTETGFMSGRTSPRLPIEYTGPETMHTARPCGTYHPAAIKIGSCRTAYPHTAGQSHGVSSYA